MICVYLTRCPRVGAVREPPLQAALLIVLFLIPHLAHANAMEDTFGLGARMRAMGGAGTAAANDYSATYYNPAALTSCERATGTAQFNYVGYQVELHDVEPTDSNTNADLRARPSYVLGACGPIAFGVHYGFTMGVAGSSPQFLKQQSVGSDPEVVRYGKRLEQLSIMGGLGAKLPFNIDVGAGFSAMVNSVLGMQIDVPILVDAQQVHTNVQWDLKPAMSAYAGIRWRSPWSFDLAVAYRSAMFHDLNAKAHTAVQVAGVLVDLDLLLRATTWFSPHQLAFGGVYRLWNGFSLAADLTWYHWSAYPGPFIDVRLAPNSPAGAAVNMPASPILHFRDTVEPRLGLEYVFENQLALRTGYGFKPAVIEAPSQNTNILDTHAHSFSGGIGYPWVVRVSPTRTLHINTNIYANIGVLQNRRVNKQDPQASHQRYNFGGWIYDAGIEISMGLGG